MIKNKLQINFLNKLNTNRLTEKKGRQIEADAKSRRKQINKIDNFPYIITRETKPNQTKGEMKEIKRSDTQTKQETN